MLNHTYTSVKNANLVDCGRKQHIPSQPTPLLKENFLGEFRTELDKKKVLAALGIATELSLEWGNIGGNIGDSTQLMTELNLRTKYTSALDGMSKTIGEGIKHLESIVGGEEAGEAEQDRRISEVEEELKTLQGEVTKVQTYLTDTVDVNIEELQKGLESINTSIENITSLINVSKKDGNALTLLTEEDNPGLYVPDLSGRVGQAESDIEAIQKDVQTVKDDYVKREEFGDGDLDFVSKSDYNTFSSSTSSRLGTLEAEIKNTVKTGEDGHVNNLFVNQISKNNNDDHIKITDSFEMESGIPLDVRCVVKSIDDLHALDPAICYAGMCVIVSNQSSLYILREPSDGIIDEAYIQDAEGENWKCPEDLVIEVITKDDYKKKVQEGSINQHMFYYIHENAIEEPNPKDYQGGAESTEYKEALDRWQRYLQDQYMSAGWGQEIEKLVAGKASQTALKSLEQNITNLSTSLDALTGNLGETNVQKLSEQVNSNTQTLSEITNSGGELSQIHDKIKKLTDDVSNNYVTKDELTSDESEVDYIFMKTSEFEKYKTDHAAAVQAEVTSDKISTSTLNIGNLTVEETDNTLTVNDEIVAFSKDVPIIEIIENDVFKNKTDKHENTYYYVIDDPDSYLLRSDLENYQRSVSESINNLNAGIKSNRDNIGVVDNLITDNKSNLVSAINELTQKIAALYKEIEPLRS